jgi:hypothetical protein
MSGESAVVVHRRTRAEIARVASSYQASGLVRDDLADILPGLADRSIQSLEQLTPAAYAASKLK